MKNPAFAYRQISVQGATPLGLIVMLYDGAIAALDRAVVAIEARDIAEKCQHIARAQAIILQLEGTLNFAAGGDVAHTLKALYLYARGQILKANLQNSAPILRDLNARLATVREAWYSAEHRAADEAPVEREILPADLRESLEAGDAARSVPASFPYGSEPDSERPSRRYSA